MKNLDQIAQDLFNKIRSRFESVTIGDDEGKVTTDPSASRFYDFTFADNGNELGTVSIALFDDKISVVYNENLVKDASEIMSNSWYDFLKDIRRFAKRRLLSFDTRNITKSNLKKRDYKFLSQETKVIESKLTGTSTKSNQRIGMATLCIRHAKPISDNSRSRIHNIDSIFIESNNGERFRYPYKHLKGARAMARHVSEGGTPYDDFGKHVIGLSEELYKLNRFKRHVNRSRVMAEGLSEYVDAVHGRVKNIKKELENAQSETGYKHIIENFENVILEEVPDEIQLDWIDQLTIKQFNEELKDIFPYVYRLISEHRKPVEIDPDYFH